MKPRHRTYPAALALMAALALAVVSCANTKPETKITSAAVFVAAPFTNPCQAWQVPTGIVSPYANPVDNAAMADLDGVLADALAKETQKAFLSRALVEQCQAKSPLEVCENLGSSLTYWAEIGKCAKANFILVPQAILFRERVGGEAGADRPAKIILDLYLIDVRSGGIYRSYHHDEEQKPLTDNVLDINQFVKRGGKWVTARELATEALRKGVLELGL